MSRPILLNEKRAEFQSIEPRLKVNVVLIPNIHLETPNYTVTRLRHDELNQAEPPPPSYAWSRAGESRQRTAALRTRHRRARKQPSKAYPQGGPAPIVVRSRGTPSTKSSKQKLSIISKIFGWFKRVPRTTSGRS